MKYSVKQIQLASFNELLKMTSVQQGWLPTSIENARNNLLAEVTKIKSRTKEVAPYRKIRNEMRKVKSKLNAGRIKLGLQYLDNKELVIIISNSLHNSTAGERKSAAHFLRSYLIFLYADIELIHELTSSQFKAPWTLNSKSEAWMVNIDPKVASDILVWRMINNIERN